MKRFFFNIFTAFIGTFLAIFALVFVLIGQFSKESSPKLIQPNSLLKLSFTDPLPELTGNVDNNYNFNDLGAFTKKHIGLYDYIKAIEKAKEDKNIKGIYLELENASISLASAAPLRKALSNFKESGKFVYAYANNYSKSAYYLATSADSIFINPMGNLDFLGFASIMTYYKGALDKIGVKATPFYAGKFKSATEPFRFEKMSEENRIQTREYIEGLFAVYLQDISKARNIDVATLRNIADNASADNAQATVKLNLIDGMRYKDEIIDLLYAKTGLDTKEDLNILNIEQYIERSKSLKPESTSKNIIAVVYAEGNIVDGEGALGSIGGDKYAKIIRDIRKKEDVKAIVLRINSGGGSSLASDIIWREIEKAKAQGIKVVVSMGMYAASGGYYIASNADYIFAEESTLTGSIGVFGLAFNTGDLYKNKLGVTIDTVKTTNYSAINAGSYYGFADKEAALIQKSIEEVYDTFKTRVSEGRKLSMAAVEEIAQGRIWLGSKAKEIGLVDSLGGLQDAIKYAATLANLDAYKTSNYPKVKHFTEEILNMFSGVEDPQQPQVMQHNIQMVDVWADFPEVKGMMQTLKDLKNLKGAQMRMPYTLEIQ